ncbi:MAG: hypothetical protein JOZ83_17690 [Silvibacterium sp.]|nr:hypothetical protein [Silvibacterium sp.]
MDEQFFPRMLRSARCGTLLLSLASVLLFAQPCRAQVSASHPLNGTQDATPEPAIPAILKAFETFEVVAMPAAHGQKDIDDFILSLIRDPRFPVLVNDIVVECGNVRYQPILDRYIAGENVPFTEVQHVWRDTTVQQMCGASGFYEQLYPLVRSLNQRLPASSRLRVVAADPPIDWSKIQTYEDLTPFFDRDGSIASVMEKEVLSKRRKALILFGIFHLLHGGGPGQGDAVTRYERHYPGRTFVISEFGCYGTGNEPLGDVNAPGGVWPSLLRTKNSRLGSLGLDSFLPSPITTDQDCNVSEAFGANPSETVADQIDAFLYLGPQKSALAEPLPADIALDRAYRSEWLRRMRLVGLPGPSTLEEIDAQIVASAADPMSPPAPRQSIPQEMRLKIRQDCLSRKHPAANTAP